MFGGMDSHERHLHLVDTGLHPVDDFARSQLDLFTDLIAVVGDASALWTLETTPLPDEPFDWSAVDDQDLAFVEEVLALSDRCCDMVLDAEFRTIARRILARVAAQDPRPFRRRPHAARCAASLVWLAGHINGEFAWWYRTSAWLWRWFGVSNCSDRGRSLCRAAGLDSDHTDSYYGLAVGDPSLLHSEYRARLCDFRDRRLEFAESRRTWSIAETDGKIAQINVRAQNAKVVSAVKGVFPGTGRGTLVVGFGDRVDDAHYVALSIPDAHELVRRVELALAAPLPKV